ncbi:Adenine nucleotide alpha hydrolases-like superfamily protein [Thalictrum thalictroides]|uniref:Adenine nucleotide alpha hydrolases-like superfamily protein n=1 Tax=Thalictrum thalictroides TaxID=46969 RepID=A0A7J6VSR9_THATH|nr:Adenine nucleotide alpha hydrolases-like superfamily protein [Thalictrum thalictroides]
MGRTTGMKSPNFNLSRVSSMKSPNFGLRRVSSHVRVRSQPIELETTFDFIDKKGQINHFDYNEVEPVGGGKRIMVVVDSSPAAKCALQWTLSHSVQNQDTIVLLYVTKLKSSKQGKNKSQRKTSPRVYELLRSMKNLCFMKRPEVQVEIAVVEAGKMMKGPIIVEQVKKQGVTLLVLGKRKRSMIWHAVMRWRRKRNGGDGICEYCIENASSCMTVAVRNKGRIGGYLITTRRHKDFWLLA